VVVQICNSSYLGGRDRKIMVWGQPRQKLVRPYHKNKLGIIVSACGPSFLQGGDRMIAMENSAQAKVSDLIWKTN
jgi:hypothetical protein